MNVLSNVSVDCGSFESVDIRPTELQNLVMKDDLLFNGSSETPEEVGMCAHFACEGQRVFLNSFCFGFRFFEAASASGLFFAHYFRGAVGRELLRSLAQGATRYNLSKSALLRAEFALPSLAEQIEIASVLSDMDAEIDALGNNLDKAREIKQGMMQELLTGKIRLI